jgi:hypothetical protein
MDALANQHAGLPGTWFKVAHRMRHYPYAMPYLRDLRRNWRLLNSVLYRAF